MLRASPGVARRKSRCAGLDGPVRASACPDAKRVTWGRRSQGTARYGPTRAKDVECAVSGLRRGCRTLTGVPYRQFLGQSSVSGNKSNPSPCMAVELRGLKLKRCSSRLQKDSSLDSDSLWRLHRYSVVSSARDIATSRHRRVRHVTRARRLPMGECLRTPYVAVSPQGIDSA